MFSRPSAFPNPFTKWGDIKVLEVFSIPQPAYKVSVFDIFSIPEPAYKVNDNKSSRPSITDLFAYLAMSHCQECGVTLCIGAK